MKDFRFTIFPYNTEFAIFVDTIYLSTVFGDGFADLFFFMKENEENVIFIGHDHAKLVIGVDLV